MSLFLKGKKKKELILVVKHPGTKFDMSKFGKELSVAGGCRFANADQLQKSLGVAQDFVSPLALAKDEGCTVDVVIDAALQPSNSDSGAAPAPLFVLPPGCNTQSWALPFDALHTFVSHGGRTVQIVDIGAL